MILIDTSFLIAQVWEKDDNHKRALELVGTFERTAITTGVLSEFATLYKRKSGGARAAHAARQIMRSDCLILTVSHDDLMPALEIVEKYGNISFCDAESIIIMKRLGIKEIASFDSDFDRVPSIKRVF